jgi:hypothetical protein
MDLRWGAKPLALRTQHVVWFCGEKKLILVELFCKIDFDNN